MIVGVLTLCPSVIYQFSCDRRSKLFHLMLRQYEVVTSNEITLNKTNKTLLNVSCCSILGVSDMMPVSNNHFLCDRRRKLFHLMLQLHFVSASNERTLVGDHMKRDLLPTGIFQNSDNQTTTDIQLSLTGYESLFHLMFQLHAVSTSIVINAVGDHMKIDLLPTSIMSELRQ